MVVFEFSKELDGPFRIGRSIAAIAQSQLAKELGPSAPYRPYQASLQRPITVITEDGVPPVRYRAITHCCSALRALGMALLAGMQLSALVLAYGCFILGGVSGSGLWDTTPAASLFPHPAP